MARFAAAAKLLDWVVFISPKDICETTSCKYTQLPPSQKMEVEMVTWVPYWGIYCTVGTSTYIL
jgi:hypothetical protein